MGEELVVRVNTKASNAFSNDEPNASTFSLGMDVLGGSVAYISHAHSDHSEAVGGPLPIFCSDVTAALLGLGAVREREDKLQETTDSVSILPASMVKEPVLRGRRRKGPAAGRIGVPDGIELHPAGHILGATQLVADTPAHGRLVYTGDFKLRDGLTVKGAPILQCDTLLAECTYGEPSVSFPPAQETWENMERWSRQNKESIQLWGGYSTGKAQELVKFLNDYLDIEPVVSGRVAQVCAHYSSFGMKLRYLEAEGEEAQEVMRGPFSAVLPPHVLTPALAGRIGAAHRRKALTALATGWALVRPLSCSIAFPISDHADFGQIVEYASGCGAKTIYLAHGDNAHTAKALRAAGFNAWPVEQINAAQQMVLKVE